MEAVHEIEKDRRCLCRDHECGNRSKLDHLADAADQGEDLDAILGIAGEAEDDVHANG
ncbi:hypothetical protein F442_05223 [Phytophthora nicotianae P10297]|uniref:Uncharacterized protein n=1 Tax=Phytophthora nicotianae P10297 TaxID=1317064 RepID=W2ZSH8_PHYNI|nr:hypothetical protein F442_05223 [Phytophthora nicotianae P10297]